MPLFKWLPDYIQYLLKTYVFTLAALTLLRLFLFLFSDEANTNLLEGENLSIFSIGWRYDSVVLCYLFALPLLLFYAHAIGKLKREILPILAVFLVNVGCTIMLVVAIAEIPYFNFFKSRLSESAFQWLGALGMVTDMIVSNNNHLVFLILSVLGLLFAPFALFKLSRKTFAQEPAQPMSATAHTVVFLIAACCCFLGMRGRLDHPIRQGDAFFGENAFLNQLGLNPVFTLLKSYTDKVNLMDDEDALANTIQLLHIQNNHAEISPIAHDVHVEDTNKTKYNVVLVLMESMSADYLGCLGSPLHLTPHLDSLAKESWLFTHAYSAGIHTNNGIFSTLYSFPAVRRNLPMSNVPTRIYSGIPFVLKQHHYRNLFFSTHSSIFDNMGVFIPQNHFDRLFSAESYPAEANIGPFGVPDDYMFDFALERLKYCKKVPFFATILTTSNHDPYILPSYFKSKLTNPAYKAVSYADWAIGKFLANAKKQAWYENTLFVFVADHGIRVGQSEYDMDLSFNHIPIIYHCPKLLKTPKVFNQLMGQIDVFPTLMHLLNMSYTNNTLGVDVLQEQRPMMYFSADDKLGCIDSNWLYVYRYDGYQSLYDYQHKDKTDYAKDPSKLALMNNMRSYALSQTQAAQWLFVQNKTSLATHK